MLRDYLTMGNKFAMIPSKTFQFVLAFQANFTE